MLSKASITRPADTTTYAAGDVVGTVSTAVIEFTNCLRAPKSAGLILGARLIDEAAQTLRGVFELWLFSSPITVIADNAPWCPTHAEVESLLAVIQFQDSPIVGLSGAGVAGNLVFPARNVNRPFQTVGSTSLYGYLVVRNAYVPISQEKFQVALGSETAR